MYTLWWQDEDSSLHPATTEYTHKHNRLICRHTLDYVTIDVHTKKKYIYIALAKHWELPEDGSCVNRNMLECFL